MANTKHAIIQTDLLAGTDVGAFLGMGRYLGSDGATPTEIDNGHVVKVGNLIDGERDLRVYTTPAANTPIDRIGIIATPERFYDGLTHGVKDYTNEEGLNLRTYLLTGMTTSSCFLLQDSVLFEVSNIAAGVGAIRRQRITGPRAISITTAMNGVKIYADEDQILGGKLDVTDVIERVARSMVVKYLTGVLIAFNGLVADNLHGNYLADVGSFDEDAISKMIETVQADTEKPALIIGTARALRNLQLPTTANAAQNELAALGYYANWYGTPVLSVNQRYLPGTKDFIFPSDTITILAGEDKFIKLIREGDALIDEYQPHDNPDRTWEYLYRERSGIGIACGINTISLARYTFA